MAAERRVFESLSPKASNPIVRSKKDPVRIHIWTQRMRSKQLEEENKLKGLGQLLIFFRVDGLVPELCGSGLRKKKERMGVHKQP